jgi:hypothetical protein
MQRIAAKALTVISKSLMVAPPKHCGASQLLTPILVFYFRSRRGAADLGEDIPQHWSDTDRSYKPVHCRFSEKDWAQRKTQ